ncbi:hypothetical protein [Streptomyces syringium]|uniref:Uncharacterized protein n=1 Tax=Streptomyces syringium TaxID=76729 RepID=A0ABS4XX82_9ACTN|nr:hypothetical protein [Streptomyces syringium]MBP2401121.1 hypothetical protein [Streptomyces syringium]
MSGLKLVHAKSGVTEVVSRLAEAELDVQVLAEANLEAMVGVRILAGEYSTGSVHGGRVNALGH